MRTAVLLLALAACADKAGIDTGDTGPPSSDPTPDTEDDADGDGHPADEDCDDTDEDVHPGAFELCNGVDDDCDGSVDEDVALTFYEDADGDGYGDINAAIEACEQPADTVTDGTDCADDNPDNFPGADEYCDGADNDCDGDTDEGDAVDATEWYYDADNDGYGYDKSVTTACSQPCLLYTSPSPRDDR